VTWKTRCACVSVSRVRDVTCVARRCTFPALTNCLPTSRHRAVLTATAVLRGQSHELLKPPVIPNTSIIPAVITVGLSWSFVTGQSSCDYCWLSEIFRSLSVISDGQIHLSLLLIFPSHSACSLLRFLRCLPVNLIKMSV